MCGRFTLISDTMKLAQAFNVPQSQTIHTIPRYNVAPTQNIVTIVHDETTHFELLRWGLIPSWSKDESMGAKMINARAETLAEKPSFKRLLHTKRCLIAADGFYEWKKESGGKTPMYITLKSGEPFTIAGLWDMWKSPEGVNIRSCTIITTEPNELVSSIHNRMPAILSPKAREEWLNPSLRDEHVLLPLLTSYTEEEMDARPVSRLVNNPQYDSAELIA